MAKSFDPWSSSSALSACTSILCAFHQLAFRESQGHILACPVLAILLKSPPLNATCLSSTPCWKFEGTLLSKECHHTQFAFKLPHQLAFSYQIWKVCWHQYRISKGFQEHATLHQATNAIRGFLAQFCRHLESLLQVNPFTSRVGDTKIEPCPLVSQIGCSDQLALFSKHPLLLNFIRKGLSTLLIAQQSVRKRCLVAV